MVHARRSRRISSSTGPPPKAASAQYKQLFFVVDAADAHITQSIIIAPSGDIQTITFGAPDHKTPIKSTTFQFTPKALPKYQVVP